MGRDEELAELVGDEKTMRGRSATHGNSSVDNIKASFNRDNDDNAVGIRTVEAIFAKRGIESRVKFIRYPVTINPYTSYL